MRRRAAVAGLCLGLTAILAAFLVTSATTGAEATASARSAAAPHVLPFARQLTGPRNGPGAGPTRIEMAEGTDGCDHAYGSPAQCVPWRFPTGAKGCVWLHAHGLGALPVAGRDRHGLDTNHDGIACGPGDAAAG